MVWKNFIAITTLTAATLAGTAFAGDQSHSVGTAPGQQKRGVRLGAPELRLTLKDAVALALEHNINLEVARLDLASAREGVLSATGIFDPGFRVDFSESSQKSPAVNQLAGSQQKRRVLDLALDSLLPTGALASVSWTNARSELTGSKLYLLNPSYSAGFGFQVNQPLLDGFGTDVNRAGIEVAKKSRDISRLQFEQVVITTVQAVEGAYWNLVYTRENLTVKQQSLKLAQDLLDQTRTRVRIGTSAPIDIVQSEATVAAREQEIIVAENEVEKAADLLKRLMGFENVDDWASVVVPVDTFDVKIELPELDSAISMGLDRRLELKARELELGIRETTLLVADSTVKPKLNLNIGYGFSGVAGTYLVPDPVTGKISSTGWGDALQQIGKTDYPQWTAGLTFSYPLGNNQARAQRAQRRFELTSAEQNFALQRQDVIADVRNTVRGLHAAAKSIAAAVKARELAARNLDAEQKKFANGMSTNYQVLQIQEDLAAAQVAELNSRVAYRVAAVLYKVAEGDLLDSMEVTLRDEPEAAEPHTLWRDVSWLKARPASASKDKTEAPAHEAGQNEKGEPR
ncbi:MAG: TolC family protein [Acidobacteriota bacterium]